MSTIVQQEEIEKLIEQFQAGDAKELHVRFDGFEIYLSRDGSGGINTDVVPHQASSISLPATATAVTPAESAAGDAPLVSDDCVVVKAPYMGTFYRTPKPGAKPYVEIGQTITAETEMCLVEVMKLFTAVRAGVSGVVKQVLVEDGSMVQAGQPLFAVEVV